MKKKLSLQQWYACGEAELVVYTTKNGTSPKRADVPFLGKYIIEASSFSRFSASPLRPVSRNQRAAQENREKAASVALTAPTEAEQKSGTGFATHCSPEILTPRSGFGARFRFSA
jgi:hypothetical protein